MTLTRATIDECRRVGGGQHHLQAPVDAEAHSEVGLVGLDVDVAGPAPDRLDEQEVAEGDDRVLSARELEVVDEPAGVVLLVLLVVVEHLEALVVEVRAVEDLVHHALRGEPILEIPPELGLRARDDDLPRVAGGEADVVEGAQVVGVHHGDPERVVLHLERYHLVLPDDLERHEVHDRRVHLDVGELDDLDPQLGVQSGADLLFGAELELDQHRPEAAAAHLLDGQRARHLRVIDDAGLDQDLSQSLGPLPVCIRGGRHHKGDGARGGPGWERAPQTQKRRVSCPWLARGRPPG